MDQNTPLETLRDGRVKATVWENTNADGEAYHTVSIAKTYEDRNGKLQDSHSFSAGEFLRVAELARDAHRLIRDVRRDLAHEHQADRQTKQSRDPRPSRREDRPARFQNRSQPGLER